MPGRQSTIWHLVFNYKYFFPFKKWIASLTGCGYIHTQEQFSTTVLALELFVPHNRGVKEKLEYTLRNNPTVKYFNLAEQYPLETASPNRNVIYSTINTLFSIPYSTDASNYFKLYSSESNWHFLICYTVVGPVFEGRAAGKKSVFPPVSSNGEKLKKCVWVVEASVCAVMRSSHASVLRKYVTVHLSRCREMQSSCKSARQLEGREKRLPT